MAKKATKVEQSVEPSKFGVFVSWSGDQSKQIAEAVSSLIPNIFQDVQTFVSSNDIDAGTNWFGRITDELAVTEFGVLCLTPDNLAKQWIHFEAGALAKRITDKARVVPYLHGVATSDLSPPLSLFNGVHADKAGTLSLLKSLNSVRPVRFEQARLQEIFDKWWPDTEAKLKSIPKKPAVTTPHRDDRALLEEILAVVRGQQSVMAPDFVVSGGDAVGRAMTNFVQVKHRDPGLKVQLLGKLADIEIALLSYDGSDSTRTFYLKNYVMISEDILGLYKKCIDTNGYRCRGVRLDSLSLEH
jgi:hypothetical protein